MTLPDAALLTLAGLCALAMVVWAVAMAFADDNIRQMPPPPANPPDLPEGWPRVSIIVPARNEEAGLPRALASLEALDYPNLEFLFINDHSTDRTGKLLADFAGRHPDSARVITDPPLPPGWMGKNNAVWRAAGEASGEWLLFTDADIVFASDALRRAVAFARERQADIAPALLRLETESFWEKTMLSTLAAAGLALCMIRQSRDPRWKHAMGVGAFTLVRREAYFAAGGHAAIAGQAVEDVWLARLLKAKGFRYDIADGTALVKVRMYTSLRAIFAGFRKNTYAATEERVWLAFLGVAGWWLASLAPVMATVGGFLGWIAGGGSAWGALAGAGAATWLASAWLLGKRARFLIPDIARGWPLLFPVAGTICGAIVLASTWDGAVRRRVHWRGRVVGLKDAKKG
jgi:glycosyltransferase involved in cell wall biosynthesis